MAAHRRLWAWGPAALLAALPSALGGCATTEVPAAPRPVNHHFDRGEDLSRIRRVLVLPFAVDPSIHADAAMVRAEFLSELHKLQRFEVVAPAPGTEEDRVLLDSLVQGRLAGGELLHLTRRFGADAALTGTVLQYHPYQPPVLGLRVQLVSVHTGRIAWAAEGVWDAGDGATRGDVLHYARTVSSPDDSLHGWEMTLLSRRRFARFVSHRLVETWKHLDRPAAPPR